MLGTKDNDDALFSNDDALFSNDDALFSNAHLITIAYLYSAALVRVQQVPFVRWRHVLRPVA